MRYACIDIGSNTTRLLVVEAAEGRLRELASQRDYTRLGKGLRANGRIPSRKVAETAEVVARQARAAVDLGVDGLAVVATAAVRQASNGEKLVEAIQAAAPVIVEILSDEEEARLAFVGATGGLGTPSGGPVAVVDIGGGSCEVAVGEAESGVSWWRSIPVGSGSITDTYLASDPPASAELRAARTEVEGDFAELSPPAVDEAIAVGGTARSVKKLVGRELGVETLARAVELLASTPSRSVAERFDLDVERARLLLGGALILAALTDRLGSRIAVGPGGLREGVILELASGRRESRSGAIAEAYPRRESLAGSMTPSDP